MENLGALEYKFTKDDESFIDDLVQKGHSSMPDYTDPAYPIEGRRPR